MHFDEETWKAVQSHLHYTDEEMALFRNNPCNGDVMAKAGVLMGKTIVVEVVGRRMQLPA